MTKNLFDGKTLKGWHAVPRLPVPQYPGGPEPDKNSEKYKANASTSGTWTVEDGAIIGRQEIKGLGGYLLSDDTFGDIELSYEARPDWSVDTGLLVRATSIGSQGFQILLDHRKSGNIGGFYGNGIGQIPAFHFTVDADFDSNGKPIGIHLEKPEVRVMNITSEKLALMSYAIEPEKFIKLWRWGEWNSFTVRCVGKYPVLTSWINGVKMCEMDTGTITYPHYDREAVSNLLGPAGHIALEVHSNDPLMGDYRWAPGAACRWRNIQVKEL
ncbi:MAG: DUF1080 domain-containing protein [Treponema sp.]|nr:DUF1080 domain-containing protein [Treponema sp.]